MIKTTAKKNPCDIQSQAFSAVGSAQNQDFSVEVQRAGDATGALVQTARVRRTKGKQDEVIQVGVEEIPSLIAILQHAHDKLIPATNTYGLPPQEEAVAS